MIRINLGKFINPKTGKSKTVVLENKAGTELGALFGVLVGIGAGILTGMFVKETYNAAYYDGVRDVEHIEQKTLEELGLITYNYKDDNQ